MSVVTIAQYRVATGDETTASATVQSRLDMAEEMLEDHLGRTFAYGTYTEYLRVWPLGLVYPAAVPVESVSATGNYTRYDSQAIIGAEPEAEPYVRWEDVDGLQLGERIGNDYEANFDRAYVTYTGGWTDATIPTTLMLWISKLARALDPTVESRPPGANLVRVGDVQVSYDKNQISGPLDVYVAGLTKGVKGYYLGRK